MRFQHLTRFSRINVVGSAGSGKSTFARALAKALGLPYFEMDRLFWKPNWEGASDDELLRKLREVTSGPGWILDGNYKRTIPDKWEHVQLVIWLDLSFPRTVFRVTKRTIHRVLTQQELWPGTGNRESLAKAFLSKDSIIWWSISNFRRNRQKYAGMMTSPDFSHLEFLRLRSPSNVKSCLEFCRSAAFLKNGEDRPMR